MRIAYYIKLAVISAFLCLGVLFLFRPPGHSMESLQKRINRDFPEVRQIEPRKLASWLLDPTRPAPLLLDIRTPEEYAVSHLPGAELLEPGSNVMDFKEKFKDQKEAILYCSVGYRASAMAREFIRSGWTNVRVLKGSIFQWIIEDRALVDQNGNATRFVHPYSFAYSHLIPAKSVAPLPTTTLLLNHFPLLEKWRLAISGLLLFIFLTWETAAPAFHWFKKGRERIMHGTLNY